jgi:filamentous hemagglutinin family protein
MIVFQRGRSGLPSLALRLLCCGGFLLLSALPSLSQAQITLDGSLGPRGALRGPNYLISDRVGQIHGPNLFHSFGQFNLSTGEIAIFTGPSTIHNIVGRVTGGSPSMIDGLISTSSIPGANLYLLNPSGVMFGPNASLDVSGSFHVSTADYLRLADGARFSAHLSDTTVLTVAPPAAFGFLGPTPAPMSVSGSRLEVPEGQTLSFIGGDLTVAPFRSASPTLMAPGGRITLVSVSSSGEVGFHPTELLQPPELNAFTSLGRITLSGNATLDASGTRGGTITSGGTIVIRGGHLMVDFSTVTSVTRGDVDGAETGIDIGVAGDAVITNQTEVGTATRGAGRAGVVRLTAGSVEVSNGASLSTRTFSGSTGLGGDMNIEAGQLTLIGDGRIISLTQGAKQAGTVTVTAHDTIRIAGGLSGIITRTESEGAAGRLAIAASTLVLEDGGTITASSTGTGPAGDIRIEVGQLTLSGGAAIDSGTEGRGPGGIMSVTAHDMIRITGRDRAGLPSRISSNTLGEGAAGHLAIAAPSLVLEDGGTITASTAGTGWAGDIRIEVGQLTLSGGAAIDSSTVGRGPGGITSVTAHDTIRIVGRGPDRAGRPSRLSSVAGEEGAAGAGRLVIEASTLSLEDGGALSVATTGPGPAGDIRLEVGQLTLGGGAVIDSSTFGPGVGGTVTVRAREAIHIAG